MVPIGHKFLDGQYSRWLPWSAATINPRLRMVFLINAVCPEMRAGPFCAHPHTIYHHNFKSHVCCNGCGSLRGGELDARAGQRWRYEGEPRPVLTRRSGASHNRPPDRALPGC
jgi:hypothetical protein